MKRENRNIALVAGGFVLLLFMSLGVLGYAVWSLMKDRDGKNREELATEKQQELKDIEIAFHSTEKPTPEQKAEFEEVLLELNKKLANPAVSGEACFDMNAVVDSLEARGVYEKLGIRFNIPQQRSFRKSFLEPATVNHLKTVMEWDNSLNSVDVIRIRLNESGHKVVVVAKHKDTKDDESIAVRFRWWLSKKDSQWRIYDFESLDVGMRFTELAMASIGQLKLGNGGNTTQSAKVLRAAMNAMAADDFETCEKELAKIRGMQLMNELAAMRCFLESVLAGNNKQSEIQLHEAETALRLKPDFPAVRLQRASALFDFERYEEVLQELDIYNKAVGEDYASLGLRGSTFFKLGRKEEARKLYTESLTENPSEKVNYENMIGLMPEGTAWTLIQFILKSKKRDEMFNYCFNQLRYTDACSALLLVEEYRLVKPENIDAAFSHSLLLGDLGLNDEAWELFTTLWNKNYRDSKDDKWRLSSFISNLETKNNLLIYPKAAKLDRRLSFRSLVNRNDDDDYPNSWDFPNFDAPEKSEAYRKDLQALIDEHAKHDAKDPYLAFQKARIAYSQKKYTEAEALFAEAETLLPPAKKKKPENKEYEYDPEENDRVSARNAKIHCWFVMGRGLEAFERFGADQEIFESLAWKYEDNKDPIGLDLLIEKYQHSNPNIRTLHYWQGQHANLIGEWELAADKMNQVLKSRKPKPKNPFQKQEEYDPYQYLAIKIRLRALVRLNRWEEAKPILDGQPTLSHLEDRLLLLAKENLVDDMLALLGESYYAKSPKSVLWLYQDELLGPELQKPSMKKFRDVYPFENKPEAKE